MTDDIELALEAEVVASELTNLARRLRQRQPEVYPPERQQAPCAVARRKAGESHLELARRLYAMRRARSEFLPPELLGEPTWDMLLDLYIRLYDGRGTSVTSACLASAVPATTALRWLKLMEEANLIERVRAEHDARVSYVRITHEGARRVQRCLETFDSAARFDPQAFLLREK